MLAPPRKERLGKLTPAQTTALRTLNSGSIRGADVPDDLLDRLVTGGWVSVTISVDGADLYTIRPFAPPPTRPAEATRTLSKFTVIRRSGDEIVAEHPLSWSDIVIHDARVLADLSGLPNADLPESVSTRLTDDLAWTGHTATGESERFETRSWGAHELWFHRHANLSDRVLTWDHFGPTRWADGQFPPLPARRETYPGEPIGLYRPDLDALRDSDPSITTVLEDRVSTRAFDDAAPITVDQLGELLYRTARTKLEREAKGVEYLSRPYPSGGAVYELEIYPVIRNVAGVKSGMYHYDSFDHVLRPVAGDEVVDRLLRTSSMTLAEGQLPQVLLVVAARAGRLMWTYEQVPYGIILKHVGVLLQTVYLAATAMGLGAVAQGYGDSAAFTEAVGCSELAECNVGSIVVGTPA